MKRMLCCLLVLGLSVAARADLKESEEQIKHLIAMVTKAIETMEGVKDRAGAEKAKPALTKLFEEMDKAGKQFDKMDADDKAKLEETYKTKFVDLRKRYRTEIERLRKDEAIAKALADVGPFKKTGREKVTLAQYKIVTLEKAVQVYKLKTGDYPESLVLLSEGEKPIVEKPFLKDPWGKVFQYDPKGPKNKGAKPDIWAVDPDGKTIGNWDEKPAPPKDK